MTERAARGSLTGRWSARAGSPNIRGALTIEQDLPAGTKLWLAPAGPAPRPAARNSCPWSLQWPAAGPGSADVDALMPRGPSQRANSATCRWRTAAPWRGAERAPPGPGRAF